MADYYNTLKTNYFKVKSEEDFLWLMSHVAVDGGSVEILMSSGLLEFA